jgi:single-strand DNA-binding protein
MELTGTIKSISDLEQIKTLKKKTLLIQTGGKYPQTVPVEFLNDNIDKLNNSKVGDSVNVGINLNSREYKGKYYINLTGWKIQSATGEVASSDQMPDVNDNLPF